VRDFTRWTDEELDGWLHEQATLAGLAFAVEQRPRPDEDAPTVWFAALRDTSGLALVGAEALSERWAKNALAQILDSLTDTELRRLLR
jgi:hypothetical protein